MKSVPPTLFLSLLTALVPLATAAEPIATADTASPHAAASKENPWRASKIIGTNLKNSNAETVGEVEDLIVDLKSGEILGVVVSTGGFLGVADTLSTIPSSVLRYDDKNKVFMTSLTKQQLEKAPSFKKSAWPESNNLVLSGKLREFRDSIGGDVTRPDNSARNETDVKSDALTPMDQGTSDADIKHTKDIRAAIVDADLSFNTKNVKVITRDGKVTLRGVVSSAAEQKTILEIAGKHAGPSNVTDQTVVKSN